MGMMAYYRCSSCGVTTGPFLSLIKPRRDDCRDWRAESEGKIACLKSPDGFHNWEKINV